VLCAVFLAQRVGGFADDLQEAFRRELPDAVFVPGVAAGFCQLADLTGSFEDVGHTFVVAAAHRSTDSARMA
jgi:hypothetical protein